MKFIFKPICFIALFFHLFGAHIYSQSDKKTGKITGTVIEKNTQLPVIGAIILIEGTKAGSTTDSEGRFIIQNIEVGTYTLKASCVGYKTIYKTDVVIRTAQPVQVFFQMDEEAVMNKEVIIKSNYYSEPLEIKTSVYGLNYEEIRRQPGAQGDVQRLIQTMPGVLVANDNRNDLIVRGGSPNENITLVDNIDVPNLSHFSTMGSSGGPISMLNTELINEANFMAGGFPVQYGNKLSSVLNIRLREGNRDNFSAVGDLSMAGAGVIVEGPLADKGSWILSLHRSYFDLLMDNKNVSVIPDYSNYQLKINYNINPANRIWLISLGGTDEANFKADKAEKDDPETKNVISGGWRTITGFNWQMLFGKAGYGTLAISDALDVFKHKVNDPRQNNKLIFQNYSKDGESTIKYDLVLNTGKSGQIVSGISAKIFRENLDIQQPIGIENPYIKDSVRIDTMFLNKNVSTPQYSAYIQTSNQLFPNLEYSIGIRYDYFDYLNKKSTFSPRMGLTYKLMENFNLNASYGIFYQMPSLVYLTSIPANKNLDPIKAEHYVLGFAYFPMPDIKITLETYLKEYTHYPVSVEYSSLSLANTGDNYSLTGNLIPYISKGSGYSRGIELFIQKRLTDNLYGQISYTHSKTMHKALDGIERSGNFDIPDILTISGGYRLNEHWEFSGKFSFSTGRPYTPVDFVESAKQNRHIYDLTKVNAGRLPDYNRLDLRVDYRANFTNWGLVTYIDLENVYDRQNIFAYTWNERTNSLVKEYQFAFMPVFGIKVEL
jgi:hypothetical protein